MSYARTISFTNDKYKEFIKEYDEDKSIDLGTLCEKHSIAPADFLADINREMYPIADEAMKFAKTLATGIIAQRLPKVVERGMIEGAKADGVVDRHFTLQKEGFHIAPKGTQINIQQQNVAAAGLQSFEDQTRELNDIFSSEVEEDHLLEAGQEPDYIEAELREEAAV